jgi:hypothetical protein
LNAAWDRERDEAEKMNDLVDAHTAGVQRAALGLSRPSSALVHHRATSRTPRGSRFILVVDRDGVSVSLTRGRRLAFWIGSARRRFGFVELFTPREGWLDV